MYQVRTAGYSKRDQVKRWALPDRVFFACGACHILAYAFLERRGDDWDVEWIRPATGFVGNHIFVSRGGRVFDYHGYSDRGRFLDHEWRTARRLWPGWDATLKRLPREALVSEAKSRMIDGLWLREPAQFLCDPLPRARRFLDRFHTSPEEMR
ncbi:MAG: hypothetical protein J0H41_19520 [Rhizobiales bacterium]|nr:hypothetical protein [Hyphomicrobiales bacterium]